jgi:hypothetical protein
MLFVTFFLDEKSNQKHQDCIKNAKIKSIKLKQNKLATTVFINFQE